MRYWKRVDKNGKTTIVESYSHSLTVEGAIEITKKEFNDFIASLPVVKPPDFKAEWATATTQAQKISILAKKVGLE